MTINSSEGFGPQDRYRDDSITPSRSSIESVSSLSSTSAVLEHIHAGGEANDTAMELKATTPLMRRSDRDDNDDEKYDEELARSIRKGEIPPSKTYRRVLVTMCGLCLAGWLMALFLFLRAGTYKHSSTRPHDPLATQTHGSGRVVTFDSVLGGEWYPRSQSVSWIHSPGGDDGMVLEQNVAGKDYLVVEDILSSDKRAEAHTPRILMKQGLFEVDGKFVTATDVHPSPDLKKVLVASNKEGNWRHSSTGKYWIFDVASQRAEPLDPSNPQARVQLATWSPRSDSIVFTRENNMFLRHVGSAKVTQITEDGGLELFYGVPDWVYEEEVFSSDSATWWSESGDYLAFLRTNETEVQEYPIQYYLSRPSGKMPSSGLENYPDVREIKYPTAGSPNPTVKLKFYDVAAGEVFDVDIADDYPESDRLITEVVWAGRDGKVLVRETNRVSDTLKVLLIDVKHRSGKTVRSVDVKALDGGWFEVSESTKFVPSDPGNGRPHDGYIDTVIYQGYDHLAYFTPLDNPKPVHLTTGSWEVVDAPSSIDLKNNLVYFVAAKKGPGSRHVYSVKLDGTDLKPTITDDTKDEFWEVKFSTGSGYALLSYKGPDIPMQKIVSTPSLKASTFEKTIENNDELRGKAAKHELPIKVFSTVDVDGVQVPVVERRPPHFNEKKKYPVVFQLYQGPGSQSVDRRFAVDFQSYMASNLGYIVVTVDGRGTGFKGRDYRCIIRGNVGHWEAHDQIAAAKIWAAKHYVDPERIAIWGWSYGGFMTLKTLEVDAGQTFKYGVAVAPVTDWRFYDSIYTERYMNTPQDNPSGYNNATISNVAALSSNVRFLMMHGTGDDNVHFQNSLTLLDELDLKGIENYDFHAFPDSDHSIYFHGANSMVYGREYLHKSC